MIKQKMYGILMVWLLMCAPYALCYEIQPGGHAGLQAEEHPSLVTNDRLRKAEALGQWMRCLPYIEACLRDQLLSERPIGPLPTIINHAFGSLGARIMGWCIAKVTGTNPLYAPAEYKKDYPYWCVGYEFFVKNLVRYALVGVSRRTIEITAHASVIRHDDAPPAYDDVVDMMHL